MSNDEATPVEDAERSCVTEALESGVELLLPREVPLGGPRALPVLRSLPNKHRHCIGAWCFADSFGPVDISSGPGMEVPPHPHTGLQTVSWLVEGGVLHHDSIGSVHAIEPGGLNIMTAGHGISHSEYSTGSSPLLHGVQLWVALPAIERGRAPSFQGLDAVPRVALAGGIEAAVLVGSFAGQTSEADAFTPLLGVELSFSAAAETLVDLDASFEHGVLALATGITVDDVEVPVGAIAYLDPGRSSAVVGAAGAGRAILLGGEPFDEEIVMFWNFVGTSHADVAAARETWMRERESQPAARERFGTVADDSSSSLPSPRIPTVELLPRGRARRR